MTDEEIKYCKHCEENNCGNILCREKVNYIKTLEESIEDWKADHTHNLELMKGLNERILELKKENAELKTVCDYNCPDHKLATHNACLMCPAIRNSPHHDLKNVSDDELEIIIKNAEIEMEM